jgi:hypothetical protein
MLLWSGLDPVPAPGASLLAGERGGGEGAGGADDGGGSGRGAQEASAAEPSDLLTTGGVVVT